MIETSDQIRGTYLRSGANALKALAAVAAVVLWGCGPRGPAPVVVQDDVGRSVALPDSVARVVTLAPSLTEMVFAAGGGSRLVAVSTADDFPPEVDDLQRLAAVPVNFEAVVGMSPDLVLMNAEVNRAEDADRLANLGVPAFVVATQGFDEVSADVRLIGTLLGTSQSANLQADLLQSAVDSLRSLTSNATRPRVLLLIGYNTLYAFGGNSYIHDVIHDAGGESITRDLQENPELNEEYVVTQNPDVIIVAGDETFRMADLVDAHPAFRGLTAVQNSRVHAIDADLLLRPGPRLVSGAYRLATVLHPDLFVRE